MTTASIETKIMTDEQLILSETDGAVGLIRLNRPKVLNALNPQLMTQLAAQLEAFDADDGIHVIVLAGSERAFAAGADIGDMAERSMLEMYKRDQFATWARIALVHLQVYDRRLGDVTTTRRLLNALISRLKAPSG